MTKRDSSDLDQADTAPSVDEKLCEVDVALAALCMARDETIDKIGKLKAERIELMKRKYEWLFQIYCSPGKSDHSRHNIGLFTTRENAQKVIPPGGSSYGDCEWYYRVVAVRSSEKGLPFDEIDKCPRNFPYTADW